MGDVLGLALRVLTFRATREQLLRVDGRHLALGLGCTWLVGIGRYWDAPRAHPLQLAGLGSLVYVFVLAAFLFLLLWPLGPKDWSLFRVLTFVTLVSPPALLYAIPVERFVSLDSARAMNAWFLGVVAVWRVALLVFFLRRLARFGVVQLIVGGLLPLTVVVTALFLLNLEHVTFDFMGGIRDPSPNDTAYEVVFGLAMLSSLAVVPLLVAYLVLVVLAQLRRRRERAAAAGGVGSSG